MRRVQFSAICSGRMHQLILLLILIPLPAAASRRRPSIIPTTSAFITTRPRSHRINGEKCIANSCRPTDGHYEFSEGIDSSDDASGAECNTASHIVSITSTNVADLKNANSDNDGGITVQFASDAGFIAVTGESGSGKSLLVCKAIDLISGGKATASLLPSSLIGGDGSMSEACVEVGEFTLYIVWSNTVHISSNQKSFSDTLSLIFVKLLLHHSCSDEPVRTAFISCVLLPATLRRRPQTITIQQPTAPIANHPTQCLRQYRPQTNKIHVSNQRKTRLAQNATMRILATLCACRHRHGLGGVESASFEIGHD